MIALFSFFASGAFAIGERLMQYPISLGAYRFQRLRTLMPLTLRPASIVRSSVVVFAAWMPYAIVRFPGIYWSDTTSQLADYYGTPPFTPPGTVSDQHPFAVTFLLGGFSDMGKALFGDPQIGLYALILLQCACASAALALAAIYLARFGASWGLRLTVLGFFAFFPLFPMMFTSLVKDTLSAPFFILFILLCWEIIRTKGTCLVHGWFLFGLVADALCMCLTKKTGAPIAVLTLLALAFIVIGCHAKMRVITTAALLGGLFAIMPFTIFPLLHISPGGGQEMLAVPLQQIAHVVKNHGGTLDKSGAAAVRNLFKPGMGIASRYSPISGDGAKNNLNSTPDIASATRLWITQGLHHPGDYVSAWAGMSAGWFSFSHPEPQPSYYPNLSFYADNSHRVPTTDEVMKWDIDTLGGRQLMTFYDALNHVPVLGTLLQPCLWASVLPFFLIFLALGRPRGSRIAEFSWLLPVLLTVLTLYVASTSLTYSDGNRYVLPLVCAIPLCLAMTRTRMRGSGERPCSI
jgi:hypothetical protein